MQHPFLALCIDAISADTCTQCLTVNDRLARVLWAQILETGSQAMYPSSGLCSFMAWVEQLWQQLSMQMPLPQCLSEIQWQALWAQVVRTDTLAEGQDIERAKEAYLLCQRARVDWQCLKGDDRCERFYTWCVEIDKRLQEVGAIHQEGRIELLIEHINSLPCPDQIIMMGFDDVPPLHRALLDAFQTSGTTVLDAEASISEPHSANVEAEVFRTQEEELLSVCQEAQYCLEHDDTATCAIVLPNLNQVRHAMLDAALRTFFPERKNDIPPTQAWPFTITGGEALASISVVRDGFMLLKSLELQGYELFSACLRSSYVAGAKEEQTARIQADLMLRDMCPNRLTWETLLSALPEEVCPQLRQCVQASAKVDLSSKRRVQYWLPVFKELLNAWGWPGSAPLSSTLYQAVNAFFNQCASWCTLDAVCEPISFKEAVYQLEQLCMRHSFAPESSTHARCHIMGALEFGGQSFDRVFVCQMSDEHLPAPARPNPFLPYEWGKMYDLPHATPERQWRFAKQWLEGVLSRTPHLTLSYARDHLECEKRPSPLLMPYVQLPAKHDALEDEGSPCSSSGGEGSPYSSPPPSGGRAREGGNTPPPLEPFIDPDLPLDNQALSKLKGGTGILTAQSLCSFKAFAEYRLFARALPKPPNWVDQPMRGQMMHEVLAYFWQDVSSHEALMELDENALISRIERWTQQVLDHWRSLPNVDMTDAWLAEEKTRVVELVQQWLTHEKERSPFTVQAFEAKIFATIGGLPLSMRIDRIDRLSSGARLILDYKTGVSKKQHWFGERPIAPQLPAYIAAMGGEGIAFAQLSKRKVGFVGVSEHATENGFETVDAIAESEAGSWSEQCQQWRDRMHTIGTSFRRGRIRVDPVDTVASCQYCDLAGLCRIKESIG